MKKWLVGLLAAGLCAASAWAETNTVAYFVQNKAVTVMQGEAPEGSSAIYSQTYNGTSGQAIGGTSITLALKGYEGTTVTGLRLAMHSNSKAGAGSLSATCGDAVIGSIADAPFNAQSWYGAWSQIFVDVTVPVTPTVIDDDIFITIAASSNSLYCEEFHIDYIPAVPKFSISLNPGDDFTVVLDTPTDIRAIAENATGSVEYAWTLDGTPSDVLGDTFTVDTSVSGGSHEVGCVATDTGTGATSEASVRYTVVGAYTVTVAEGIENGAVAVWDGETELGNPADVLEGTKLKVVATPATRSYKVESISVTGETSGEIVLENDEFTMPAENVSVTARFVERTQTAYSLVETIDDFEAGADYLIVAATDNYTSAMKNVYVSGSTGRISVDETISIEDKTVETEDDSIVWTIVAGAEGKYTLYNAAAGVYVSAPSSASVNEALLVEDDAGDAAQWTIAIDTNSLVTIGSYQEGKSLQRNSNANNKYFANYKGGTKPFLFKKVGSGVFSISLDPSGEDVVFPEGEEATITATAKNAQGEVTYSWNVTQDDTPGSAEGNVWTIPADAPAGGPWTLYCSATDGTSEADQSVSFSIEAAPVVYEVTVEQDLEGGRVDVDPTSGVAGTIITVTAAPENGYRCDGITVNGEPLTGSTFELPEGGAVVSASFVQSNTKKATYTVESTSAVSTTGVVPEGSEAVYSSTYTSKYQLIGGTHMTLTLTGYDGTTITGLKLSMKSNGKSGSGSLSATCGDATTTIGSIADAPFSDARWHGSFSSEYVDITVPVTPTVVDGDVVITLTASANSIYCQSFTIEYEPGTPVFDITLDHDEDFAVVAGEAFSIEATPKNNAGDVTYVWTVDGVPADTSGNMLSLTAGEASETPHEVVCMATDTGAEGVTAEASVKYTVIALPAKFAVTIADGIENGTVALSVAGEPLETPAEVEEGTEVTVAATPADGYALEAITVNGVPLDGTTTFTVTAATEVSATFAEVVDYATLPFLAEDTPYAGPWKKAKVAGLTSDGLDNDYGDGAAKFIASGNWLQIKFVGTPGTLTYNLKGNGTSAECVFEVKVSAIGGEDEESWTTLATYTGENALPTTKSEFSHELSADSRYVRFVYAAKDKGNVALYDVYISSGEFSVSVDKTGFELEEGMADTVTAAAKNGTEPYTYAWTSETGALNGEGAELAIPGTLAVGEYAATVTATDADGQTATADVAFTVVEPKVKNTVEIAIGILNGTVEADVAEAAEGDTVTLTAHPAPGFKLGFITVSYESGGEIENLELTSSPATFTMPATEVLVGAVFLQRGEEYVKIASVDALEEGEYVITGAGTDGEYAMLAELSDSGTVYVKRRETPVKIEGDAIAGPEYSIVWTLAKAADGWTIHNDAIGYVGYVVGGNSAGAEEEASEKSTWTISASDGLFLLTNVGNTGRYLLYNASSPRFACYDKTSSGKALAFYKKAGPAVFAVSVDKTGFELAPGEAATVTATARNGAEPYRYVWTSETEALNGEGAALAIPDTLAAGEYAATVTVTDSSEPMQTATAEVAFTVVAPLFYTVTVADGIENGTVAVDKTEAEAGETVTVTATPADNYKLVAILVNGAPIEGNTFEIAGDSVVSAEFAEIVKFHVYIGDGILNGTVEADKEEAEAGETVTLTAFPADGYKLGTFFVNSEPILGGNTFTMPEGDALVTAEFVPREMTTYERVDSAVDFEPGDEYLIVAVNGDSFTSAMKNEANGDRIGLDEVELKTETTIETDNDAIVWVIQAGKEPGQYTLFNAAGVYAAAKSDGNYAQIVTAGEDDLAQWTLDLTALPEAKIVSASYPSRWLQRNSTPNNKYFATYTGSQTTPSLYKKAGFSVGFVGKEDGFTVDEGTADSITAAAVRGVEPYSYTWTSETAALNGEGATLAIPDTLAVAEEPYSVTVTATDSSEPPQTASKTITFSVLPPVVRFAVTVDEGIEGGEVTVDKAQAEPGEEVTVTATPAEGNELGSITVSHGDEVLEFDASPVMFQMPASDVTVSATFREIVDYVTLPFVAEETPYRGPWQNSEVAGLTHNGLGTDYDTDTDGVFGAKFRTAGVWMQIKFKGTPGRLTYGIKGNGVSEESGITFRVQESADGATWEDLAVYTSDGELGDDRKDEQFGLSEESRFVRFFLETKTGEGNVGIYDVYISEAGEAEPFVTVSGATTVRVGETFQLVLGLENYSGAHTWTNNVLFGWINPDDSTFYWTAEKIGDYDVTFLAMDGKRVIASTNVTLTIRGNPALVFEGAPEGAVGEPVTFTVVAENTADPTVTFMGFLELPEGSALTDADVDFDTETGKATFTPDVTGDYGLAFCAGTGDDYIEDHWPVRVTAPKPKLVFGGDSEGTVGKPVTFTVEAVNTADPTVTFDEFVSADYSELEEEDVTFDFPNVSFTPDVPGDYYFSFTAGTKEGGDFVVDVLVITVTDEEPVAPTVTEVEIDVEHGLVTLTFTGTGAEVWGTDDLMGITDQWAPMEAVIEGDTAIVEMNKHFLRVQ